MTQPEPTSVQPAQVTLRAGDYTATTTAAGGALGSLRHGDRDLVLPSGGDLGRPAFEGAICAPWPNRVVDGRWTHDGTPHQLAITEPDRGHALHGFVHDREWALLEATETAATWQLDTVPQQGYPWALRLTSSFHLDSEAGLSWEVAVRLRPEDSEAAGPAAYGVTVHPYLVAGDGPAQDWTLELPATSVLAVDDRLVPRGSAPVDEEDLDFRAGRVLGTGHIDHAFGGLTGHRARLFSPAGTGVEVSWDAASRWVQIFTAQWDPRLPRHAVALEPMTCPPDAFNSGTDVVRLGEEPYAVRWQFRASPPGGDD